MEPTYSGLATYSNLSCAIVHGPESSHKAEEIVYSRSHTLMQSQDNNTHYDRVFVILNQNTENIFHDYLQIACQNILARTEVEYVKVEPTVEKVFKTGLQQLSEHTFFMTEHSQTFTIITNPNSPRNMQKCVSYANTILSNHTFCGITHVPVPNHIKRQINSLETNWITLQAGLNKKHYHFRG